MYILGFDIRKRLGMFGKDWGGKSERSFAGHCMVDRFGNFIWSSK